MCQRRDIHLKILIFHLRFVFYGKIAASWSILVDVAGVWEIDLGLLKFEQKLKQIEVVTLVYTVIICLLILLHPHMLGQDILLTSYEYYQYHNLFLQIYLPTMFSTSVFFYLYWLKCLVSTGSAGVLTTFSFYLL
ncbi:hypothetical protein ACJX0J_022374, partial [Zea mays]